jgi:hypothetical protein
VIDADLGFHYTIPFADGARRVIAWQEAHAGFESCDQKPCYDAIIAAWERLGAEMSGNLADIE